jgi:hypothetical protein
MAETSNGSSMMFDARCFADGRLRKRRFLPVWGAVAFAVAGGLGVSEAEAQQAMGWLEIKQAPGQHMVQITGHALALEKVEGADFTLSVTRASRGGKSNSRQAGRISLGAGETKVLSSTAINLEPGDGLMVELKILEQGREVFSTVMSAKPTGEGQTL